MKQETKGLIKAGGLWIGIMLFLFGTIEVTASAVDSIHNRIVCKRFWKNLGPKGRNDLKIAWADSGKVPMTFADYLMNQMYGKWCIDITGDKRKKILILIDCLKKRLDEPLEVI